MDTKVGPRIKNTNTFSPLIHPFFNILIVPLKNYFEFNLPGIGDLFLFLQTHINYMDCFFKVMTFQHKQKGIKVNNLYNLYITSK